VFEPDLRVEVIPKIVILGLKVKGGNVVDVLVVVVEVLVVVLICGARVVVVVGAPGIQPNSSCISFNDSDTGGFTQALIVTTFSY
jgi:hypothetical protein